MIVRRLDSMAVLLCLLALICAASSHTLNTSALQSMAAAAPEPGLRVQQPPTEEILEQKDPTVLQGTAARAPQPNLSMQQALEDHNLQQQQELENNSQFPASADTFLKALRAMQDADSLFQASTYNAPSYSGVQWWSIQASQPVTHIHMLSHSGKPTHVPRRCKCCKSQSYCSRHPQTMRQNQLRPVVVYTGKLFYCSHAIKGLVALCLYRQP